MYKLLLKFSVISMVKLRNLVIIFVGAIFMNSLLFKCLMFSAGSILTRIFIILSIAGILHNGY